MFLLIDFLKRDYKRISRAYQSLIKGSNKAFNGGLGGAILVSALRPPAEAAETLNQIWPKRRNGVEA